MTMKPLLVFCTFALMAAGCATTDNAKPLQIDTDQHSPVRLHVYDWPADGQPNLRKILVLPPLGVGDSVLAENFHQQLCGAARRRFATPIAAVFSDSAYAPYICESNLIRNDGTINTGEIAFIGALMNCSHVIVPLVRELNPYHPQRIDLRIILVNSGSGKICAELSSMVDARNSAILDYFTQHAKARKGAGETLDDLRFEIKSPEAFQAFVADLCSSVMAQRLSL